MPSIFYINKCKKVALRKTDRNCLLFANSRREMLLKAIGNPQGTVKGYKKAPGMCPKAIG
jgi:hypothetical protein